MRELMPKKIAVDLQYEATRTFWSDLQLLFEMVLLILGRSYRVDRDFCVVRHGEKHIWKHEIMNGQKILRRP